MISASSGSDLVFPLDIWLKLSQITGQCWGIVQRQDNGFWPRLRGFESFSPSHFSVISNP
mgnify:CR=1 FL=1